MGLTGKLTAQIEFKSGGDVFHELFRFKPHQISEMSPQHIQSCDLHEGDWGHVGSVIFWKYTHDGKEKVAKEIIEAIDEETKSISFKVVEGDLMELYKDFTIKFHVETHGEIDLITWAFAYEKLHQDVDEPLTLLGFCLKVTSDIENHHTNK